jgi:hypothetical protein
LPAGVSAYVATETTELAPKLPYTVAVAAWQVGVCPDGAALTAQVIFTKPVKPFTDPTDMVVELCCEASTISG